MMRHVEKAPKKNIFAWNDYVVLFFLFLAAMNFNTWYAYCVFVAFALFLVLGNTHLRMDSGLVPLIFLSLSILLFDPYYQDSLTAMLKAFIFPMCYFMGYNLPSGETDLQGAEKATEKVIFTLALGTWMHLALNMVSNWSEESGRNTIDFWTGSVLSATNQAALAVMMIGFAIAIFLGSYSFKWKLSAIGLIAVVLIYNLRLGGRTIFFLALVALVGGLLYQAVFLRRSKRFFASALAIVVLLGLVLWAYTQNLFGIQDFVVNSNFYERFFGEQSLELDDDGRLEKKLKYLPKLFTYPWGGAHIREEIGGYAHDLYLDTYDEAGLFAFAFVIVLVIGAIRKMLIVLRSQTVGRNTKLLLACVFLVLNIEFWVEPILAGVPWLLACFCVIYGATARLSRLSRRNRIVESVS